MAQQESNEVELFASQIGSVQKSAKSGFQEMNIIEEEEEEEEKKSDQKLNDLAQCHYLLHKN